MRSSCSCICKQTPQIGAKEMRNQTLEIRFKPVLVVRFFSFSFFFFFAKWSNQLNYYVYIRVNKLEFNNHEERIAQRIRIFGRNKFSNMQWIHSCWKSLVVCCWMCCFYSSAFFFAKLLKASFAAVVII